MKISVSDESFTYDVYGLVQAFYPYEPLSVVHGEGDAEDDERTISIEFLGDEIVLFFDGIQIDKTTVSGLRIDTYEGRKEVKNKLKRLLYRNLSAYMRKELPWGTLTGIRPTKIPLKMLLEGRGEGEIASYMQKTYLCSDEKIHLAMDIAKRELSVLGDFDDSYALYIGIPFCPSICLYCSFSSYPIGVYQSKVEGYLDALEKEIAFAGECFAHRKLSMIYVGGGTPTSLSASQLQRLFATLHQHMDLSYLREFTVEAGRPDSITLEKLAAMKEAGVGRISINPQTMQQKTLDRIGRIHTVSQVLDAYQMARKMGFLINMDTIIGLPGETKEDVFDTMHQIQGLQPDNLTVHSLAIKRSSRLNENLGEYGGELLRNSEEIMQGVTKVAEEMEMSPYYLYRQKQISGNLENIGFAPSGKECLYNIVMMEELSDVIAIGSGSVSKRLTRLPDADGQLDAGSKCTASGAVDLQKKISRCENVKDVDTYIQNIDEMILRKKKLFHD